MNISKQPHVPLIPKKSELISIKPCKYLLPCGMCDYLIQINSKNKMCSQYEFGIHKIPDEEDV